MAGKTITLCRQFKFQIQLLEATRQKMEHLYSAGQISEDDIDHVYSGLFLDLFTEFERLIEELFLGLLSGNQQFPEKA